MLLWLDLEVLPRTEACFWFGLVHTFPALQFVEQYQPVGIYHSMSIEIAFRAACAATWQLQFCRLLNGFVVDGQRRGFLGLIKPQE